MYKRYDKEGYDVLSHYFDSITEFLDYLEKTPTSSAFQGSSLSSQRCSDSSWSGTDTYEQAIELAKYGCDNNFDEFIELKLKLERYIKLSIQKSKTNNYYVGYAPDVKAYLEGCPLNMFNRENPPRKQIDIYYNVAFSGGTSTSQIYNRGVITLSMIETLEKLGFNVNLNIFDMTDQGNQIHFAVFNLKNTAERLNVKKLFFPLCHNAWQRRLIFRLEEVTPDITYSWTGGYGHPASKELTKKIIDLKENDIILPQPSSIGIKGNDLIKDADTMFHYINEETQEKDFELPHLQKVKTLY